MKRILITGAKGRIGKILSGGLNRYELTLVDLPEVDVKNYDQLEKLIDSRDSCDVIIHLAWNTETENHSSKSADPDNLQMAENIYRVAITKGIPRVVMASSIHADDFRNSERVPLSANDFPKPQSPYGKSKVKMEEMGRVYSGQGLEVVCIRFGAVGYGEPPTDEEGKKVWLSKRDCVGLIRRIINLRKIPNDFSVVYGVSNNHEKVHDLSNSLRWKPRNGF